MSFINEFKKFALRGNVIDLAIGIIIGAAFGKIVSSLVSDIIMPPLGAIINGVKFTDLKFTILNDVTINIGMFLQTIFDFVIIVFALFLVIKATNKIHVKKEEAKPEPTASKEELLLTEIRDLLKEKNK